MKIGISKRTDVVKICFGCKFWIYDRFCKDIKEDVGKCRRYPPILAVETNARYWCGEWQEKETSNER